MAMAQKKKIKRHIRELVNKQKIEVVLTGMLQFRVRLIIVKFLLWLVCKINPIKTKITFTD